MNHFVFCFLNLFRTVRPWVYATGLLVLVALAGTGRCDERRVVGGFSEFSPGEDIGAPWEPLKFPNIEAQTDYRLTRVDGTTVVQATSNGGASGLIRKLDVDLNRFPWIVWRWRIEGVIENGDLTLKAGDDCPARVYVAFQFDEQGKSWWQKVRHRAASIAAGRELPGTALTYVWGNRAEQGAVIISPYTDQSRLVVVRSGNGDAGQWVSERRNIADDYRSAFGTDPPAVIGLAIMTDTDNTGGSAVAYYGDLFLEAD